LVSSDFWRLAVAGGVFAVSVAASPVAAQTLSRIDVEGTQRIEPDTVRSYIGASAGEALTPELVDRTLKNLFATGLFADVSVRREGDALVVRVIENPVINRVAFEGNQRVKDDKLAAEVQLRPRTVYTRTRVQQDVKRILDVYRRSGRFAATVEPKVIQLEQNRVDLVFEIQEGEASLVKAVNFVGNRAYSDSRLREELATKEERWYRFLSTDDTYDPDRLTFDRELLRRFYLGRGYADFRVDSVVAELTPDRSGFLVTFTVSEGERYRFGEVGVETTLPELDPQSLQPLLQTASGEWYNAGLVEDTIQTLTDVVGDRGYAFVDIRPRIARNPEERTVDIVFDVQEGPRVFVERIDIVGNVRTLDEVIRREFRLVEGDAFNTAKLRRSRQRIRDLNFFERVEVTNIPSEVAPDRTVIKVEVEEKSTGELSFGVGFSTAVGPLLEIAARERNLLGRGQSLRIAGTLAGSKSQLDLGFTEPYFLDRHISAGFDVYAVQRELQDESSYDSESVGGNLRLGYWLAEDLREDWRYTLRRDNITDVSPWATRFIRDQIGHSVVSMLSHTFTYDLRDSRIDPTEGWYVRWTQDVAGLGGTEQFVRSDVDGAYYYPIADQWVAMLGGSLGGMTAFGGSDIRINERYFVGGDSLRGFATAGIGARDANGDALGGKWMYAATAQLSFPLGLPQELGLTGKVFTDVGGLGPTEELTGERIDYHSTPRLAVGAGVTWRSPFGPLSIDVGFPVVKQDYDDIEYFRFNFGTRF